MREKKIGQKKYPKAYPSFLCSYFGYFKVVVVPVFNHTAVLWNIFMSADKRKWREQLYGELYLNEDSYAGVTGTSACMFFRTRDLRNPFIKDMILQACVSHERLALWVRG